LWLSSVSTILLDCDGVVWRGNTVIPGVPETIKKLKEHGKQVIFVSNNSTKSRRDTLEKIIQFGIECTIVCIINCHLLLQDEVITSSYIAPAYLKSIGFKKKTYIIGQSGIGDEFSEAGLPFRGIDEHADIPKNMDAVKQAVKIDKDIGAVVVGLDIRISYTKVAFALNHLEHNEGCLYIATNTDKILPEAEGGLYCPGAGTMVAMLTSAYGKDPIILGKPSSLLFDVLKQKYNLDPARTCMVGDSLQTDIKFGVSSGLQTLLVLTGVSKKSDIGDTLVPRFFINSLGDFSLFF